MKHFLIACFAILTAPVFAQQYVADPNAQVREISSSFNAIKISGGIDVYLSQSDKEAVAVSAAESKYIDDIKTAVVNNTLEISFTDSKWSMKNRKAKVYVSFKDLQKLEASGASDIKVSGNIHVPTLKIDFTGASEFEGTVKVQNLSIKLTGASELKIAGTAENVSINSTGASDVNAKKLITEVCNINVAGASDVDIVVNKEISAVATGASSVTYSGTATEGKITKTGASSVSKRS